MLNLTFCLNKRVANSAKNQKSNRCRSLAQQPVSSKSVICWIYLSFKIFCCYYNSLFAIANKALSKRLVYERHLSSEWLRNSQFIDSSIYRLSNVPQRILCSWTRFNILTFYQQMKDWNSLLFNFTFAICFLFDHNQTGVREVLRNKATFSCLRTRNFELIAHSRIQKSDILTIEQGIPKQEDTEALNCTLQ